MDIKNLEVEKNPQVVKNLTVKEALSAVDEGKLDPVFALTEELSGRKRVSLVAALEERIEASTPILDDDDTDDDVLHEVDVTSRAGRSFSPPEPKVPNRDEIRVTLKSDAPDRVELRGTVARTFDRKNSPFIVHREYWRAVLSRTGYFEQVND